MTVTTGRCTFGLLGSFEVADGGQPVPIPGQRPRALLAILLLQPDQVVPTEQIIRGLWGGQPPKAARESVQYFVHQLRKALPRLPEDGPRGMLETRGSGYRLRVDPAQIDAVRFQELVGQAAAARTRGDAGTAWARYEQALGLWRGQALADFTGEPFAQPAAARLDHQHLTALEAQLQMGLELGRHAELAGELEALVRVYPGSEELWRLLMLALYRSGRQAEALAAYQSARAELGRRHGVEPGMELRELQRRILTQDPSLIQDPSLRPDPQSPPARSQPRPQPAAEPGRQREERKLVTALVVSVVSGSPQEAPAGDPEDVGTRTAGLMTKLTARVCQYGGVVQAVAMGRLLAVFGAGRSHEDDPERAVRAGLEVMTTASGDWRLRVGVATGEVVVTIQDPDQAGGEPPAVAGAVVSTAAGLAVSAAAGMVVVGEGTYRATRRVIAYRPAEAAAGGGLPGPAGWQALGPRARTGASVGDQVRSPLVERDRELRLLTVVFQRFLRDRQPQLLTLVSAAGLGKTRLVGELGRMVDQAPELISWRTGRSLPYGAGSLWALAEIVRAHAGIQDADPAGQVDEKLCQAVTYAIQNPDEAAWVVDRLRVLLGSSARTGEHVTAPDPMLLEGWVRFFGAVAARRPFVVVFEDLHWADDVLLEFLDELVERVGPVPLLVVRTARPELLDHRPQWGGGKRDAVTVTLSPLSAEGTAGLLDALLDAHADQGKLPDASRQVVLLAAGGNPLYVEEYVRVLSEGYAVPATLAGPAGTRPVPETIQQLIAARLDTLSPADKRLLQDAAVIGEVGWVGALAAVSGQDRTRAEAGLLRLERREFLRRVRGSSVAGETEYIFRHVLLRDVAYGQLLRADRAERHQRIAAWIQRLNPDAGERVELLAHHYSRALALVRATGQPSEESVVQTRMLLLAAGDRALALDALTAAARHYQAALDLWPDDDPARPELLLRYGQALVFSAHGGAEALAEARDTALQLGREDLAARADMLLSQLARIRSDPAADRHMRRWFSDGDTTPTEATVAARGSQAVQLLIADRHAEAHDVARQVVRLARRLRLPGHEGYGLAIAGDTRILRGDPGGVAEAERGHTLMDDDRFPLRVFARFGYAHGLWWSGDLERCAAAVAAGKQAAQATDAIVASWFDGVHAGLDYSAGRWDDVVAAADAAIARQVSGQESFLIPWHHTLRARVRLARGDDLDGALGDARAALDAATAGHDTRYRQVALALQGRVLLAAGDPEQAAERLDTLAAEQHAEAERACATPDLAVLLVDLDRSADTLPDGLPPTRWHAAVRAFAARDFGRAAELYAAIGSPIDQQLAQERAAG